MRERLERVCALSAFLVGCSQGPDAPPGQLPLNPVALPGLTCRDAVKGAGECTRRDDCGQGQLCTLDERSEPVDRAPAVLRCGPALGTGHARARCSEAKDCESGLCALAGVCVEPCRRDADCLVGQACQPVEARMNDEALSPVQACARVAAFPEDVSLQVESAEGLRSGAANHLLIRSLQSRNLLLLKTDCARVQRVERIVDSAAGHVLFDRAAQSAGVVQINPVINEGPLVPVLLPNNPRLKLSSEAYDLSISVDADTDVQVIRASRTERGRLLDLNVFYVGGGKMVDPGGLHPGSAEMAEVLARLAQRYEAIGIELGAIREYDVTGALREELAVLEVSANGTGAGAGAGTLPQEIPNLGRVFELSAGVDDGGVNLFVLERMGPLLGISGGTPGALGLHGSALSGVALALDSAGLMRADQVLFHELGHQLGLFHTSEIDGFEIEPLSDTPACSAERDSDGDGVLRGAECVNHGADNVMFWEGTGVALSPQQIAVLTQALVLR